MEQAMIKVKTLAGLKALRDADIIDDTVFGSELEKLQRSSSHAVVIELDTEMSESLARFALITADPVDDSQCGELIIRVAVGPHGSEYKGWIKSSRFYPNRDGKTLRIAYAPKQRKKQQDS